MTVNLMDMKLAALLAVKRVGDLVHLKVELLVVLMVECLDDRLVALLVEMMGIPLVVS